MLRCAILVCIVIITVPNDGYACGRRHARRCRRVLPPCAAQILPASATADLDVAVDTTLIADVQPESSLNELFAMIKGEVKVARKQFMGKTRRIPPLRALIAEYIELESRVLQMGPRCQQLSEQKRELFAETERHIREVSDKADDELARLRDAKDHVQRMSAMENFRRLMQENVWESDEYLQNRQRIIAAYNSVNEELMACVVDFDEFLGRTEKISEDYESAQIASRRYSQPRAFRVSRVRRHIKSRRDLR